MVPSRQAFLHELTKLAEDDKKPWTETYGAPLLAGKLVAANAMFRHGAKIPGVRRIGAELAGVGARAGMAGKPMVGRPIREAAALLIDPQMVALYEGSHAAGAAGKGKSAKGMTDVAGDLGRLAKKHDMPRAEAVAKFMSEIPLEAKGRRAHVDSILHPKGGAKGVAKGVAEKIRGAAKKIVRRGR